jgi:RHH-type proline utilization regulon transcriptional repressor/proline dehydrogenase/delta 1-pyrroline-5-carboxylate dehydrogenase
LPLNAAHAHGLFCAPALVDLERVDELRREVFGPVLHVVRYSPERADRLVDEINALGFGLTLGVHTRIDSFAEAVAREARVGNVYVNRNMIGAVVGVQPFGGMGFSGTGPKAGGPHYLPRFATEQTVSTNTAAVGGNASLLALDGGRDPEAAHSWARCSKIRTSPVHQAGA